MTDTRTRKKRNTARSEALTLSSVEGVPLYTFPAEVVNVFRRTLTGLAFREKLPQRLTITSTLKKEGVTYTTMALATTLASDMDVNVCGVELNWWSPGMYEQLTQWVNGKTGMKRRRRESLPDEVVAESSGLAGMLNDGAELDDVLVRTNLPNLAFLPAGDMPNEQRPMLARGTTLRECIDRLSRRFDYLLLDTPAIMATSDAIALASLGDACTLVVRQGATPSKEVRQALDEVQHLPMLGVIMNRMRIQTPKWVRALIPQE